MTGTTVAVESCAAGERLPELRREIDLPSLVRYAGASGDFNRIHYDAEYALDAGLDSVIGHGMLAMALVSRAVTDWVGDSGLVRRTSVRFASPYRIGDVLTVSGVVADRTTDAAGRTVVEIVLSCVNQEGTEILRDAVATVQAR